MSIESECPDCGGGGFSIDGHLCWLCDGRGIIFELETKEESDMLPRDEFDKYLNHDKKINFDLSSLIKIDREIKEFKVSSWSQPLEKEPSIDDLLDKYNDYMLLYEQFGDEEYKVEADHALNTLRLR